MTGQVLTSWKEIAAYLGKGVRTVQRWEAEMGLPVRRPGPDRHIVLAFPSELDQWARGQHEDKTKETKQDGPQSSYTRLVVNVGKQRDASAELERLRSLMVTMLDRLSANREQATKLVRTCERYRELNGRQKISA